MLCDPCSEFVTCLDIYAQRISQDLKAAKKDLEKCSSDEEESEQNEHILPHMKTRNDLNKYFSSERVLLKCEVDYLTTYFQSWFQRQCICCFREPTTFERFTSYVQNLIRLTLKLLVVFKYMYEYRMYRDKCTKQDPDFMAIPDEQLVPRWIPEHKHDDPTNASKSEDVWSFNDLEKVFHLTAKVFLLNFPLYVTFKQLFHANKPIDLPKEFQNSSIYNQFCDLSDHEAPIFLTQNVESFCGYAGYNALDLMLLCFECDNMPMSLAHGMCSIVCNVKPWLGMKVTVDSFIPVRSKMLRYICELSDREMRSPTTKMISELMWGGLKESIDHPLLFDRDGLDTAFKFFNSSTLTLRLAAISQINHHISAFNDTCHAENVVEVEGIGHKLTSWLMENNIVANLFGPNIHIEIIKQSQIILNFLAMECMITNEHIDIIWQATQLKHCGKHVFDVLAPLIKNLEAGPVNHLYELLYKMDPRDHTEQSLLLASSILRFIWTSSSAYCSNLRRDWSYMSEEMCTSGAGGIKKRTLKGKLLSCRKVLNTSDNSENGFSDEEADSSSEGTECSGELITPRKRLRMLDAVKKKKAALRLEVSEEEELDVDESDVVEDDDEDAIDDDEEEEGDNEATDSDDDIPSPPTAAALRRANRLLGAHAHHAHHAHSICAPLKKLADQQVPNTVITEVQEHEDLSGDDGSLSSRMSTKSEKNMADFDGEEDSVEDEGGYHVNQYSLGHFTPQQMCQMAAFQSRFPMVNKGILAAGMKELSNISPQFNLDNVCNPGSTLLWDLLQDDKIGQLSENIQYEAEKILTGLICYNTERVIRIKFIEACMENVKQNKSVVISLRLLQKIFTSFHALRGNTVEMTNLTMWVNQKYNMIDRVFNNIVAFANEKDTNDEPACFSHMVRVQTRLQFLSHIFSPMGLPTRIKLSAEQLECLWSCLSNDAEAKDFFFEWLLRQVKNKDQHTFTGDSLRHLYSSLIPSVSPESISVVLLQLLQHLCDLCRIKDSNMQNCDLKVGIDHVWNIALQANNTDVSMDAMRYVNNYYLSQKLVKEPEFIARCMERLSDSSAQLQADDESSFLRIQRELLLLKSHLELFKRRYAYHIRRWALETHVNTQVIGWDNGVNWRIIVQTGADKMTIEMRSTDLVGELRAEVAKWYEALLIQQCHESAQSPRNILKSDSELRLISGGQELAPENDERTLMDSGFQDQQIVYISVGKERRRKTTDHSEVSFHIPVPNLDCLPTKLLLTPEYSETLFALMSKLSVMPGKSDNQHHTRAQVLSRRVWDILTLLPTHPTILEGFRKPQVWSNEGTELNNLLNPESPQKLMYSMYVVEALSRISLVQNSHHGGGSSNPGTSSASKNGEGDGEEKSEESSNWAEDFIQKGGLRHLFDIFMSGALQGGSEWHQDCLAHLLKLLCQLGVPLEERHSLELFDSFGNFGAPQKVPHKKKGRGQSRVEKVAAIPVLNQTMKSLMDVELVMPRLTSILNEMAAPRELTHYKTGFWGRAQVIHFAMALLLSWSNSKDGVCEALLASRNFAHWVCKLVLEEPDPMIRKEISSALYRLCTNHSVITTSLLAELLKFLDIAERMVPQRPETLPHHQEEGKEPYGPTCRDYFWLVTHLVDSLNREKQNISADSDILQLSLIDFDTLANRVWRSILNREYVEMRHSKAEDDVLCGMVNLLTKIVKLDSRFKESKNGQIALEETFEFLFALPDANHRHLPKCKTKSSRAAAYDLLVELVNGYKDNYICLHSLILQQHNTNHATGPYPWDYWPHDDGRSECGFVGMTNLGATCYMASCMQHLFMMPEARNSILSANITKETKHEPVLRELQRMFAYLLESERKTYNPRSFCKVYTMDQQLLNTAEQKDMAEFFIDLVSKIEDMTPELKTLMKTLFGGTISNNVVSLDCDHVSRTIEEFYTVRCTVADMRSLFESLNEVTVKDTLEGDNMYTCSQCGKKVRAEKRACFKKLPKILCFNTMRYTFNMVTMMKEKVNTHFSFPMKLDMSGYVEKHLMPQQYNEEKILQEGGASDNSDGGEEENYEYELIGVTVHTGTAEGGHYYCFIRDRSNTSRRDRWYLFNDSEVKPFDSNNIPHECFGGEMTSKTFDQVTEKYMDMSFEKTNSAYMLFYEKVKIDNAGPKMSTSEGSSIAISSDDSSVATYSTISLNSELEDWIWQDNMQFLKDKNIFEHTYSQFLWQICGYIPQTLENPQEMMEMATRLSVTFVLETYIHSKEKPQTVQWVELMTKQFDASTSAGEWFLQHMADDYWWPVQILIRCPSQMVRQMYQRLVIHVINKLRSSHVHLYLKNAMDDYGNEIDDDNTLGSQSCVTRFMRTVIMLLDNDHTQNLLRNLTEYFSLLFDFAKSGDEECQFLIRSHTIYIMVLFYLKHKCSDIMEIMAEDDDEEEVLSMAPEKCKPTSLEKMLHLTAYLIEKARGSAPNFTLSLPETDYALLTTGPKHFSFIIKQIKDNINMHHTRSLICALCRYDEHLASQIISVIFSNIQKYSCNSDMCQPFYKILTMLIEATGPSGIPNFTKHILGRVWDMAELTPYPVLDWLSTQVPRNKTITLWVLQDMDTWVESFLLANNNPRVRATSALLLVCLVPSPQFRNSYRVNRSMCQPLKDDSQFSQEAKTVLHKVYRLLLKLLVLTHQYIDPEIHGFGKLCSYFSLLNYSSISREEKLQCGPYISDLWNLYHNMQCDNSSPIMQNKQALLIFWHTILVDCPENVQIMLQSSVITSHMPANYIITDNETEHIMGFTRCMLPAYYGILRMMCQQSRTFARQLANSPNMTWALKNISIYPQQYQQTCDELFRLIEALLVTHDDNTEQETEEIAAFRKTTLKLYLDILEPRTCYTTLNNAIRTLVTSDDDKIYCIVNGGLQMLCTSFSFLHGMYHEPSQGSVYNEIVETLRIIQDLIDCIFRYSKEPELRGHTAPCKDWKEFTKKLLTLLNTFNSGELRSFATDILCKMAMIIGSEFIWMVIPMLHHHHNHADNNMSLGPYFPRRNQKMPQQVSKNSARPIRPMLQMSLTYRHLETTVGVDQEYDKWVESYYLPYHNFLDILCRCAADQGCLTDTQMVLTAIVAVEGVPMHFGVLPHLWTDMYYSQNVDKKFIDTLISCQHFKEYVEAVLLEERASLFKDDIFKCLSTFLPNLPQYMFEERNFKVITNMIHSVKHLDKSSSHQKVGTLRALYLLKNNVQLPPELSRVLSNFLDGVPAAVLKTDDDMEPPKNLRYLLSSRSTSSESDEEEEGEEEEEEEEETSDECCEEDSDIEEVGRGAAMMKLSKMRSVYSRPVYAALKKRVVKKASLVMSKRKYSSPLFDEEEDEISPLIVKDDDLEDEDIWEDDDDDDEITILEPETKEILIKVPVKSKKIIIKEPVKAGKITVKEPVEPGKKMIKELVEPGKKMIKEPVEPRKKVIKEPVEPGKITVEEPVETGKITVKKPEKPVLITSGEPERQRIITIKGEEITIIELDSDELEPEPTEPETKLMAELKPMEPEPNKKTVILEPAQNKMEIPEPKKNDVPEPEPKELEPEEPEIIILEEESKWAVKSQPQAKKCILKPGILTDAANLAEKKFKSQKKK